MSTNLPTYQPFNKDSNPTNSTAVAALQNFQNSSNTEQDNKLANYSYNDQKLLGTVSGNGNVSDSYLYYNANSSGIASSNGTSVPYYASDLYYNALSFQDNKKMQTEDNNIFIPPIIFDKEKYTQFIQQNDNNTNQLFKWIDNDIILKDGKLVYININPKNEKEQQTLLEQKEQLINLYNLGYSDFTDLTKSNFIKWTQIDENIELINAFNNNTKDGIIIISEETQTPDQMTLKALLHYPKIILKNEEDSFTNKSNLLLRPIDDRSKQILNFQRNEIAKLITCGFTTYEDYLKNEKFKKWKFQTIHTVDNTRITIYNDDIIRLYFENLQSGTFKDKIVIIPETIQIKNNNNESTSLLDTTENTKENNTSNTTLGTQKNNVSTSSLDTMANTTLITYNKDIKNIKNISNITAVFYNTTDQLEGFITYENFNTQITIQDIQDIQDIHNSTQNIHNSTQNIHNSTQNLTIRNIISSRNNNSPSIIEIIKNIYTTIKEIISEQTRSPQVYDNIKILLYSIAALVAFFIKKATITNKLLTIPKSSIISVNTVFKKTKSDLQVLLEDCQKEILKLKIKNCKFLIFNFNFNKK